MVFRGRWRAQSKQYRAVVLQDIPILVQALLQLVFSTLDMQPWAPAFYVQLRPYKVNTRIDTP